MTMRELAKLANVSTSTVSKVFHDADDVSIETKRMVFDIAKKHGCYHQFYKGKYSKPVIAIICPELQSNYYAKHIEILQEIIIKNECIAVISSDGFDSTRQAELIEYYSGHLQVDGIIVFNLYEEVKKGCLATPIVAMFISKSVEVDSVVVDMKKAIIDAINYLYKLGHKKIAFIGEKITRFKNNFFVSRAQELGIDNTVIIANKRFESAGEDGAKQILKLDDKPTAIICAYDDIALGAIKHLKSSGFRVPEDFSVIGMDNIRSCNYFDTALTSIDSHPDEICMTAWELLEKKMKNKFYRMNQRITLTPRLVIRDTTAKPRKD